MDEDQPGAGRNRRTIKNAATEGLVFAINFIGIFGGILILYGVSVLLTGESYGPFERYADPAGDVLTVVGVGLVAASIYGEPNQRPPDDFSRYISAPLVMLACVIALVAMCMSWAMLPAQIVTGFALLGLAGALFRMAER